MNPKSGKARRNVNLTTELVVLRVSPHITCIVGIHNSPDFKQIAMEAHDPRSVLQCVVKWAKLHLWEVGIRFPIRGTAVPLFLPIFQHFVHELLPDKRT